MQRYDGREQRANSGEAEGALGSWELGAGLEGEAGTAGPGSPGWGRQRGWAAGAKVRWLAKEQELAQNPAVSYL